MVPEGNHIIYVTSARRFTVNIFFCLNRLSTIQLMEMRKSLLPIVMLLMTAGAAQAGGLVTKHASSVQLTVDAARTQLQELVLHSVSQDQILILLTGQLQAQFLQALSPQVFIILALLLPHRTQQAQRLASVSLIPKLMHYPQVQQLLALFLTSGQLLLTQLAPKTHLQVL